VALLAAPLPQALKSRLTMKCFAALLALLVSSAAGDSPVSKVVTLLEDLKEKINKDGDADEQDYEKHSCWCKKVEVEKKEMIAAEKKQIEKLTNEIAEEKAKDAILDKEVKKLDEEEDDNVKSQDQGGAARNKESTANNAELKEDNYTVKSIKQALPLLTGEKSFLQVHAAVQKTVSKYEPKASTIEGILNDQMHTSEDDYNDTSKAEKKASAAFKSWIGNMREDLGILQEEESEKKHQDSEVEVEIAEDTESKEATEEQKEADMAFLEQAEASCLRSKTEYNNRTAMRATELAGVNKALEILDKNRELLRKTTKTSFLQMSSNSSGGSVTVSDAAHKVAVALQNVFSELKSRARKTHSLRMAVLAGQVHDAMPEGAFTTVLSKIDGMLAKLKTEAATDVLKKDNCTADLFAMTKKSKNLAFLVQKSTAEIDKLDLRIEALKEEKLAAQAELSETNDTLVAALKLRTEQNKVFHQEKADDEVAVAVLENTSDALSDYYDQKEASLIQTKKQDPDISKMSKKRKKLQAEEHKYTLSGDQSMASDAILAVIDRIVDNLNGEIEDDKKDEAAAQMDYEEQTKLLETSKEKLMQKITGLGSMISNHGGSKVDEEAAKQSTEAEQTALASLKTAKESDCKDLLKNFDEIVSKRESEMDGLMRAKELLSGASPTLVQQQSTVSVASSDNQDTLMNYLGLDQ